MLVLNEAMLHTKLYQGILEKAVFMCIITEFSALLVLRKNIATAKLTKGLVKKLRENCGQYKNNISSLMVATIPTPIQRCLPSYLIHLFAAFSHWKNAKQKNW